MCPGQKDYVTLRVDGEKVRQQKRLLLANMKELYSAFKEKTQQKVGFAKFCELRPKLCITVGAKGTHSVCVCEIHQNTKLMLAAISGHKLENQDMMARIVCDVHSGECMLHRCGQCPGKQAVIEYLQDITVDYMDPDDLISFKQWSHTDRTALITRSESLADFIEEVADALDSLTTHHYISKAQAAYLNQCKAELDTHTALVLMDFAENYSFVIQDAIQGYYWDTSQATLHPLAVYFCKEDRVEHASLCIVSDCLKHDTVAVHTFLTVVIPYIQELVPGLTTIKYFSDGAASQYKNYKNISNLLHHKEGLLAEWHFFATSHGKSPCDGIGGTVKRLAARASLQSTTTGHILSPLQLYSWAESHVTGIKFFFVTKEQVENHALNQVTCVAF